MLDIGKPGFFVQNQFSVVGSPKPVFGFGFVIRVIATALKACILGCPAVCD